MKKLDPSRAKCRQSCMFYSVPSLGPLSRLRHLFHQLLGMWTAQDFQMSFPPEISLCEVEVPNTRPCLFLTGSPRPMTGRSWKGTGNQPFASRQGNSEGPDYVTDCFRGWQMPSRPWEPGDPRRWSPLVPWLQTTSITLLWGSLGIPEKPQDIGSFLYSPRLFEKTS